MKVQIMGLTPGSPGYDAMVLAEFVDAAQWEDCLNAGSPALRVALRISMSRTGSAVMGRIPVTTVLALNRVVGLGVENAATEEEVDQILSWYQDSGVKRFMVQIPPGVRPAELTSWLTRRGFYHHNNWVKLLRRCEGASVGGSDDFQVRLITTSEGSQFARIVAAGFDWPSDLHPWAAEMIGRPGWRHYMAFHHDTPVATAALFVRERAGWIGFAATLPEYRGKGAQSALIRQRIDDARSLGCEWLVVETAEDLPERPNASFHNLLRFGFQVAYARQNFVKVLTE